MTRFKNLKGIDPNGNIVNYVSNPQKDKYGYRDGSVNLNNSYK